MKVKYIDIKSLSSAVLSANLLYLTFTKTFCELRLHSLIFLGQIFATQCTEDTTQLLRLSLRL